MSESQWQLAKLLAFSGLPLIPVLVPISYYVGLPWLVPAFVFIGIPLADVLIGEDKTGTMIWPCPAALAWLRAIPRVYVLVWLAMLAWAALVLGRETYGADAAWLLASVALASAFATCAAHELLHWPSKFDFALSRVIMATVAYGPFTLEHLHHHAYVGVRKEGATPPLGQSVWRFVLANYVFTLRCAWRIERRRQIAKKRSFIGNRFVQQWLLTAGIAAAFFPIGGMWGLLLFATQAAFGIFTTDYVNYAQHYGLSREAGELARGGLSWNSNNFLTNAFTLNITRHVHHHLDASVPYYDLEYIDSMPLLPAGYLALFFPAMIPPMWRRLMDSRAQQFATAPDQEAPLRPSRC